MYSGRMVSFNGLTASGALPTTARVERGRRYVLRFAIAAEKQVRFISDLMEQRDVPEVVRRQVERLVS